MKLHGYIVLIVSLCALVFFFQFDALSLKKVVLRKFSILTILIQFLSKISCNLIVILFI